MKKDSQGHSGEKIIQKIDQETIAHLFTTDIQRECWNSLLDIVRNGSDRDRLTAIKELFDRGLGKAVQKNENAGDMTLKIVKEIIDNGGKS